MKFNVTAQYARNAETLIAKWTDMNDAKAFIQTKLQNDERNKLRIIYRLFDIYNLLSEFNVEKVGPTSIRAQYALGDIDLPATFFKSFKVFSQQSGQDQAIVAEFLYLNDAQLFIQQKLVSDAVNHQSLVYRIFENNKMLEEHLPKNKEAIAKSEESEMNRGQSSASRPTPLNTAPRPTGVPQSWSVDKDNKDNKDKQ